MRRTAPNDSEGKSSIYAVMRADYARRAQGARAGAGITGHQAPAAAAAPPTPRRPRAGGFSGNDLVADARKYIGTNPTGRRSLWCGAFMDKVLRDTGHKGGGNLAWPMRTTAAGSPARRSAPSR